MRPETQTRWMWIVLSAILLLAALLRIRLLEVPLDRDEGGYAYTAQLILQGTPPFASAYDMKMPGLYYVYALVMLLFGQSTIGIHLGLLVINAATIVLLYLIAKRLFDPAAGIMAGAAYAFMSLSQSIQGFSANAEHLLLAPALAGILLLLYGLDSNRAKYFFVGGLLLGTACIIKHQGVFFAGFAAFYLFTSQFKKRPLYSSGHLLFLAGLIIPFSSLCLYFKAVGLFGKFWFWLFEYPQKYAFAVSFLEGIKSMFIPVTAQMAESMIVLWFLAAAGLIALLIKKDLRPRRLFVVSFLLFSLAAILPGFYFYAHYFVLILPAIALLAGLGTASIAALLPGKRAAAASVLLVAAASYAVIAEKAYLFELTPVQISKTSFGENPFAESVEIANYIKNHSRPDDTIAVLGSEPQISFYACRRSVTPHIYFYPLMRDLAYARSMQQETIHEIEAAKPRFIVFVRIGHSWLTQPRADLSILNWGQSYTNTNYNLIGTINISSYSDSACRWGQNANTNFQPQSQNWIAVYEKKSL